MQPSIIMLSKPKYTTDVGCCKLISSVKNCDMCQLCYNVIITKVHNSMCRQEAHMFFEKEFDTNMSLTWCQQWVTSSMPVPKQYMYPHTMINNCRYGTQDWCTLIHVQFVCVVYLETFPVSFSFRNAVLPAPAYSPFLASGFQGFPWSVLTLWKGCREFFGEKIKQV